MKTGPNGELGQIQLDGSLEMGDSANWTGHWVYLTDATNWAYTDLYEVGFGAYVRHPDPKLTNNGFGSYYKNPWAGCISRDQMTGILAALIGTKNRLAVIRLILHHSLRLFLFSYNTIHNGSTEKDRWWKLPDLTLFDIWALEIRALGPLGWILYPLLLVLDIHIFLASFFHNKTFSTDPISFAIKLIISREKMPTPLSILAFKICDKVKLSQEVTHYWSFWRKMKDMPKPYMERLLYEK